MTIENIIKATDKVKKLLIENFISDNESDVFPSIKRASTSESSGCVRAQIE